jgi:hypothetical protein
MQGAEVQSLMMLAYEMAIEGDEEAAVKVRVGPRRVPRADAISNSSSPIARHSFSTIFSLVNNHAILSSQFT